MLLLKQINTLWIPYDIRHQFIMIILKTFTSAKKVENFTPVTDDDDDDDDNDNNNNNVHF
jgi:hypothetical protein